MTDGTLLVTGVAISVNDGTLFVTDGMLLLTGWTLLLTDVILLVTERILLITRDGTLTVTLLDLCLLFEHHNRVHWAQTWEDICVTFIYFIYHIFTDLPTWRPSLIF